MSADRHVCVNAFPAPASFQGKKASAPALPAPAARPAFKKSRPMGFLARYDDPVPTEPLAEEQAIIRFDSGRAITFADLVHHLLILGTTGSGKSASVVFPGLYQLLLSGAFGLIIDIKGNLREKLRALARAAGREAAIVEYGTAASATPLNLLAGLGRQQIFQFFRQLVTQHVGTTQSMDWHLKGVAGAADCAQLLLFLGEKYPNFCLDCRLVLEMASEPLESQKLMAFFREKVFDPARADHKKLVASVENNRFHILKKNMSEGSAGVTLDEQLSAGGGGRFRG